MNKKLPVEQRKSVDGFLAEVKKHSLQPVTQNRLVFAMDATASREPMWDLAASLHVELFKSVEENELAVQLVHFGGFQQFRASSWNSSPERLLQQMQTVRCMGGTTQIERVLNHILKEAISSTHLKAAVYVGDMCEEPLVRLASLAGQLGLRQLPVFVFQEGHDRSATEVFSTIASRSGGAHLPFDASSPDQLRSLLNAIAVYATKGISAVKLLRDPGARRLLTHMKQT